eukprot:11048871-Alexandrium_andersonii.AAC.1
MSLRTNPPSGPGTSDGAKPSYGAAFPQLVTQNRAYSSFTSLAGSPPMNNCVPPSAGACGTSTSGPTEATAALRSAATAEAPSVAASSSTSTTADPRLAAPPSAGASSRIVITGTGTASSSPPSAGGTSGETISTSPEASTASVAPPPSAVAVEAAEAAGSRMLAMMPANKLIWSSLAPKRWENAIATFAIA